jgi:hypothetical protein
MSQNEIGIALIEAQVLRVKPQPGEVLLFKMIGPDFTASVIDSFKKAIQASFPNNKIAILALPPEHDIELTTVQDASYTDPNVGSCAAPTSYCSDCSCGKKERIEGSNG